MRKKEARPKTETELGDTVKLANGVVAFYEDLLEEQTKKIARLELENAALSDLLSQSKSIIREVLKTPARSLIN